MPNIYKPTPIASDSARKQDRCPTGLQESYIKNFILIFPGSGNLNFATLDSVSNTCFVYVAQLFQGYIK